MKTAKEIVAEIRRLNDEYNDEFDEHHRAYCAATISESSNFDWRDNAERMTFASCRRDVTRRLIAFIEE